MLSRAAAFGAGSIAGCIVTAASFRNSIPFVSGFDTTHHETTHHETTHHALPAGSPSRAAVVGSTNQMRRPPSSKQSKVFRVALTGGPCGGKSSSLKHFTKELTEKGYDVYTAPEVPTIMINGGCKYPGIEGKEELKEFETALLKLQLQVENSFSQCAKSTGRPSVLVFDRGLMDVAAYLPTEEWKMVLDANDFTEERFLEQYDLVLHLVSAADGAEKYYVYNDGKESGNNAARLETPEEARALDKKMIECWSKHPNHAVIRNGRPFKEKMQEATNHVILMAEGGK